VQKYSNTLPQLTDVPFNFRKALIFNTWLILSCHPAVSRPQCITCVCDALMPKLKVSLHFSKRENTAVNGQPTWIRLEQFG